MDIPKRKVNASQSPGQRLRALCPILKKLIGTLCPILKWVFLGNVKAQKKPLTLSQVASKLALAASQNDEVEVHSLLEHHGADPNALDDYDRTPLHDACSIGRLENVRILLSHRSDPNAKDNYDNNPLHYAAQNGYSRVVNCLLESKANPLLMNMDNRIPWQLSKDTGSLQELSSTLLDLSLVTITKQHNEDSIEYQYLQEFHEANMLLHDMCELGHFEVVKLLVNNSSNVNSQDNFQMTPLHYAAQKGHREIIEYLLDVGADPLMRDAQHHLPWDLALCEMVDNGHPKLLEASLAKAMEASMKDMPDN